MEHRLPKQDYMAFPFEIGQNGALTSDRRAHIREQIEQVLLTVPGERVFRVEFGAGVRRLVFEPNTSALQATTGNRLRASLEEALRGEVDPKSLEISVDSPNDQPETMIILVRYRLATIGDEEEIVIEAGPGGGHG